MAAFAAFAVVALIIALVMYVYFALAYMTIARKLKTEPAWLAWIPIANVYLVWKMSAAPVWSLVVFIAGVFAGVIPIIGFILAFAPLAMSVYWMWLIAEKRNFPGWISLLMLVPIANVVLPGVLAWVDR